MAKSKSKDAERALKYRKKAAKRWRTAGSDYNSWQDFADEERQLAMYDKLCGPVTVRKIEKLEATDG